MNNIAEEEAVSSAEKRILESAIEEFTEKGYTGARMQSIADRAEISKSALHYYYRHKERLFYAVLDETVGKTISRLKFELDVSGDFEEKLRRSIAEYYRSIRKNIKIVRFIFTEMNRNPKLLDRFLKRGSYFFWINQLDDELQREYDSGNIYKIKAEELILNLVSLCIYPQIGEPLIRKVLRKTEEEYSDLITNREQHIIDLLVRTIIKPH